VAADMTATHIAVKQLTGKVGHVHELYMENFLLLQDLFSDLTNKNQLLWGSQT
jgi:hypothetical protein